MSQQTLIRPTAPPTASSLPSASKHRSTTPRRGPNPLVPVVLILAGIVVLLYPIAATFYNNYQQAKVADSYAVAVDQADPQTLAAAIAAAREYNATLSPTAFYDPWSEESDTTSAEYQRYRGYLDQLADHDAMARLRVPGIKVDLAVRHGTGEQTLANGAGHLYGTSLPVGGPNTHAVITTHSGWANATLFDRLPEMKVGDEFYVDVYGETLAYRVDQIHVVLPDDFTYLARDGGDHITLITCTPRAVNSHRLLVRGSRIPFEQAKAAAVKPPTSPLRAMDWTIATWMYPRLIAAAVAILLMLAIIGRWVQRRLAVRRQP